MTKFHVFPLFVFLAAREPLSGAAFVDEICPTGFVPFGEKCYSASVSARSFGGAQYACRFHGGYLAEVTSAKENEFLRSLQDPAVSSYLIGLTDQGSENTYFWASSRNPAVYTNWKKGEPNDFNGEDCVEMNSDGYWNDLRCRSRRHYFCESGFKCPNEFVRYGRSCYYFSKDTKSWPDAVTACAEFPNSYLVEIETKEENRFLIVQVNAFGADYWTAGTDRAKEGHFKWYTSKTDVKGGTWERGNPSDSYGGEDCLEIHYRASSGYLFPTWNDKGCFVNQRYICERPDSILLEQL